MQVYHCPRCGETLWFENLVCGCGLPLAYDPRGNAMQIAQDTCANRQRIGCNWVATAGGGLCESCRLTRTHPDLAVGANPQLWSRAEAAKRWVLVQLYRMGWMGPGDPGPRPTFDFLAEETLAGPAEPVMGHSDGLITINVSEADPREMVHRRERFGEPLRTMTGHVRHEVAHFLFLRLSEAPGFSDRFRHLFGDERADYAQALRTHYGRYDDGEWRTHHISHYASAHPHEDWAETSAHVLHLLDLVDSARAVGLGIASSGDVLGLGMEVAIAANHLNRSLGTEAPYPFVVSAEVRTKLRFALDALDRTGGRLPTALSEGTL